MTWEYAWDTSVILGTLQPGTYTVHVVSTPVDRLRFAKGEFARTDVEFLPSDGIVNEVPLDPLITIAALVSVSCAGVWLVRRSEKR
jgi:hypothetical protein